MFEKIKFRHPIPSIDFTLSLFSGKFSKVRCYGSYLFNAKSVKVLMANGLGIQVSKGWQRGCWDRFWPFLLCGKAISDKMRSKYLPCSCIHYFFSFGKELKTDWRSIVIVGDNCVLSLKKTQFKICVCKIVHWCQRYYIKFLK